MQSQRSPSNLLTKWKIELTSKAARQPGTSSNSHLALHSDTLLNPPNYNPSTGHVHDAATHDEDMRLLVKRSWDVALGPLKSVPMNLFIMYMAGNSISIFPIMMVGMMCFRPFKALFSLNSVFSTLDDGGAHSMIGQKLVFILGNLIAVAMALYKCSSMGLLPTHASDWLAFAEEQRRIEHSFGGVSLM